MSRLADYFVIVGYDHKKDRNGIGSGRIIQRFPQHDWPDAPFNEGLELFCQPQGWALSTERQEPKFFVSVFTDMDANRHYCAVLSFNEAVSITPTKPTDEEEDSLDIGNGGVDGVGPPVPFITHHSIMYAPKCLVLISTLDYYETFRNCLGIIYTVYMEGLGVSMETLIGNIVGYVQAPPPGGPQVRFSIGAGDRQALQPPHSPTLPVTNTTVASLFNQLGIKNVLVLFCAALTEHKILFHSRSYCRLTDACHALKALMYPFKYSHVYIPILPASLVEVLSTPTPFIMGVHSSLQNDVAELMDVIVADLDGGSIRVPESLSLSLLPDPYWSQTHNALSAVLHPDLSVADNAFPTSGAQSSQLVMVDKEIRAIFMRMFAHVLQGYRSCLTLIRIHAKPVITFHKAAFLGQRGMVDNDFLPKVLDCMFFTSFVSERGPPWRVCDLWDELYSNIGDQLRLEQHDSRMLLVHIQELAQQLYNNENPNPQPFVPKIPKPTEGSFTRIHQPVFPHIDSQQVQAIIDEGTAKKVKIPQKSGQPRIVPMGPHISSLQSGRGLLSSSARRLEVMRNCVNCIFENKISDARKTFPAVLRALKSKAARLALCQELGQHVQGNKAVLEHQQFDLVVRLMNCALQDDSPVDEHGVAAALLPLSTAFCRKLCTGVIQFAYTCIQDHAVWSNQQFWESSFYQDVQREIKGLYFDRQQQHQQSRASLISDSSSFKESASLSPVNHREASDWKDQRSSSSYLRPSEPSALEITAEQMRLVHNLDGKQRELMDQEESTLYSQAIHYANRMVALRVPLDINTGTHRRMYNDKDNASNSITNSVAESDSIDAESGFEDQEQSDPEANVIRFVSRFVDKVCTEGGVTEEHIKSLHQMIPGVVAMHVEMLDSVYKESKRLPPIQKPKILLPSLVPGEEVMFEGLRVCLWPDGREEGTGGYVGGPVLLPAEGALFITNYRLIFKGLPTDPYACEQVVVRSMPVSSITREKRVAASQHPGPMDQWLNEGLQIRSNTFQLIKVAFDEEVSQESIEMMRKLINRMRHPQNMQQLFAFVGYQQIPQTPSRREKDKQGYGTLRGFAKKTLWKTAKAAGLKSKSGGKRHKYVFPSSGGKSMTSPGRMSLAQMAQMDLSNEDLPNEDDLSIVDELEVSGLSNGSTGQQLASVGSVTALANVGREVDSKTLEKLTERSYYKDYQRLGLGSLANTSGSSVPSRTKCEFRVTACNSNYQVCRSYPSLLSVPSSITDESLHRLARCYRHTRLPVITWRHTRTKALLMRGAGFHGKSVMGMLKGPPSGSGATSEVSYSMEQEKYLSAIVQATPVSVLREGSSWALTDSSLSINSLVLTVGTGTLEPYHPSYPTLTPEVGRKSNNPLSKAMNTLRLGGGTAGPRLSVDSTDTGAETVHAFHKAALYVFGDKAQIKGIKTDAYHKTEFIPVDYAEVRQVKSSFKKLMRACIPSSQSSEQEQSFLRAVENSEWLNQLESILQVAGAIVDLIDLLGASVVVALEEGWDFTAQVTSIAQLCLDPYYRTLEGFRVLIEKEWLAFGHRFNHRSNLCQSSQTSGFAPIFLQFLDTVHQIQRQFPLSFEFNEYYLRFLAYHYVSSRFRTFLCDSELERADLGIMSEEDKRGSLPRHVKGLETSHDDDIYPGGGRLGSPISSGHLGQSVFDYIEKMSGRSSVFYNFLYVGDRSPDAQVLRPVHQISALQIWGYFVGEELRHGPSYDPEVRSLDRQQEEEAEAADGTTTTSQRRIVINGYDCVSGVQQDTFSSLLEELRHLELELGHLPQKWNVHWDKLELPPADQLTRQVSMTTQMVRLHGRSVHKRSTLEILVRGKTSGGGSETPQGYSHPHRFEKYNYTTPSYCDHCSSVLWGPLKTGMRCMDCGYNCHEKCIEAVPKNCSRYKSVRESGVSMQTSTKPTSLDTTSVGSGVTSLQTTSHQYYEQFSSNVAENRTHEGYLLKRGSLLKNWKQRWFVLDSIKHQLRYYDSMEDSHCKGIIELSDVVAVQPSGPTPGVSKRADDRSFFELQTKRRSYNFCACDAQGAQEWIEKIQSCLQ